MSLVVGAAPPMVRPTANLTASSVPAAASAPIERISCDTDFTSRNLSIAGPSRKVNSNGKPFMRGSKPGRSPYSALAWKDSRSVITARPLLSMVTALTVPSACGLLVSAGRRNGSLRKRSVPASEPPTMESGPRTALTRSSKAGNTSASPPSTTLSSMAISITVCATDQFVGLNTSCGVSAAMPCATPFVDVLTAPARPTSTRASISLVWVESALPIVMTRPLAVTS